MQIILDEWDKTKIRLVRIPPNHNGQEAYRHVTGLIAEVEEDKPGCRWEGVLATLENHGSEPVELQLRPLLD